MLMVEIKINNLQTQNTNKHMQQVGKSLVNTNNALRFNKLVLFAFQHTSSKYQFTVFYAYIVFVTIYPLALSFEKF